MMNATNINSVKRIAFIVHSNNKSELIEWSYFNKGLLTQHEIIASGDAANILGGTLNKPVHTFLSGPLHGYQELGNMIADGKVDILILLWNAGETQMQKNGIKALMRTANNANIIIATNKITADFILTSDLMNKELPHENECYSLQPEQREIKKNNAA